MRKNAKVRSARDRTTSPAIRMGRRELPAAIAVLLVVACHQGDGGLPAPPLPLFPLYSSEQRIGKAHELPTYPSLDERFSSVEMTPDALDVSGGHSTWTELYIDDHIAHLRRVFAIKKLPVVVFGNSAVDMAKVKKLLPLFEAFPKARFAIAYRSRFAGDRDPVERDCHTVARTLAHDCGLAVAHEESSVRGRVWLIDQLASAPAPTCPREQYEQYLYCWVGLPLGIHWISGSTLARSIREASDTSTWGELAGRAFLPADGAAEH